MQAWLNNIETILRDHATDEATAHRNLRVALPFAILAFLIGWLCDDRIGSGDPLDAVAYPLLTAILGLLQVLLTVRKSSTVLVSILIVSGSGLFFGAKLLYILFLSAGSGVSVTDELTETFYWLPALYVISSLVTRASVSQKLVRGFFMAIVLLTGLYAMFGSGSHSQKGVVLFALAQLILANVTLYALTLSSADHERQRSRQMQTIALSDPLTGLANKLGLEQEIILTLHETEKIQGAFALLYMDLDGFKAVNDQLGHNVGDDLLREVAARLNTVRRETDVLARMGGDEFVLLVRGANANAAKEIAVRIQQTFRAPFTSSQGLPIDASVGYSVYPADGTDMATLMNEADQRMYAKKRARKNRHTQARAEGPQDILAQLDRRELRLQAVRQPDGEMQLQLSSPAYPDMTANDIAATALTHGHHEPLWAWWTQEAATYLKTRPGHETTIMPLPTSIMHYGFSTTLLRSLHLQGVACASLRIEVPGSSVHRQSHQLIEYRQLIDAGVQLRLNELAEEPNAQQISRDLAKILNANLESIELQTRYERYVRLPMISPSD